MCVHPRHRLNEPPLYLLPPLRPPTAPTIAGLRQCVFPMVVEAVVAKDFKSIWLLHRGVEWGGLVEEEEEAAVRKPESTETLIRLPQNPRQSRAHRGRDPFPRGVGGSNREGQGGLPPSSSDTARPSPPKSLLRLAASCTGCSGATGARCACVQHMVCVHW